MSGRRSFQGRTDRFTEMTPAAQMAEDRSGQYAETTMALAAAPIRIGISDHVGDVEVCTWRVFVSSSDVAAPSSTVTNSGLPARALTRFCASGEVSSPSIGSLLAVSCKLLGALTLKSRVNQVRRAQNILARELG